MDNIAREVMSELRKNSILMKRAFCRRNEMNHQGPGLSVGGQGKLLEVLIENSGISQKALAELLHIRPQSLGETLQKLEAAGMVERVPNEYDKRVMNIFLSEAGKSEAITIKRKSEEKIRTAFCDLTDAEQKVLLELVMKLNHSIENHLDPSELAPPPEPHPHACHPHGDHDCGCQCK